jgi:branched-chain amino acid transport system substrate-binding protein
MAHFRQICKLAFSLTFGPCIVYATEPGSPPDIVFGMSTDLTGPAANLAKEMRQGVLAGFGRVNRGGGVIGRKLRLVALDDGYEPARTALNMRKLIDKDHVLAVIGNVGTPTAIAAIPIVNEKKMLFFAPFSGASILRNNPPDRYVINFRASYAEETAAMIEALTAGAGLKPEEIAFFTQRDRDGDSGFGGGIAALKRQGLRNEKSIVHVRYEPNTLAVENAVADLLLAETAPRAVVMVGAYAPCAKFIKLCWQAEIEAVFLNVSSVGSNSLAQELGATDAQVIVTQVVPYPSDGSILMVRDYQVDLKAFDPSASAGFGDFEGYVAARILALALDKIKGPPTRETVIDALEGLQRFDIGFGERLRLSQKEHQASHRIWPTILKEGAFVPFQWPELADLLSKESRP